MVSLREDRLHSADSGKAHRTDFRRDRDSIFYSNFFRRLAGVTQVVHVAEGHVFHNRLVHSLKVAQIGQSLADILISKTKRDIIKDVGGVDVDVVQTACLAHDLGHPPFGHIGESELSKCVEERKVREGFEGNAQSFRIVSRLAIHDERHPGLNLTSASLNAMLKYPWKRRLPEEGKDVTKELECKKWGCYDSDDESFALARARDPESKRKSAEAEIMDWADDVTYAIHDLDDFYRAGLVPLDRILAGGIELDRFLEWISAKEELNSADSEAARKFLGNLESDRRSDLLMPFQGTSAQYRALRSLETRVIQRLLGLQAKDGRAHLELRPAEASRLYIADELALEVKVLKGLMRLYVYDAPALAVQQHGQRKIVRELFEILFNAVDSTNKKTSPAIIPKPFDENLKELARLSGEELRVNQVRLVADMIASLTEQQAVSYYARLSGTSLGFLADRIFGA
jgi:dGTPase